MGNFYVNYTLRGPSQEAVAAALAGRSAIVTPAENGCVVVFDEESEGQDEAVMAELASRLSDDLGCSLLAVLNHDDDILMYKLYIGGDLYDEYNSAPDYFDGTSEELAAPSGGKAQELCRAFDADNVPEVERLLKKSFQDEEPYTFAFERHDELVSALGISAFAVGVSFGQADQGDELPEGLGKRDLIKTKDLVAPKSVARTSINTGQAIIPGYYKAAGLVNGVKPAPSKFLPSAWMPQLWADLACLEADLSDAFRNATTACRKQFQLLGFDEIGYKKLGRILNLSHRDDGGMTYLDKSRRHFGQLIYQKHYLRAKNAEQEGVVISFTAAFNHESLSVTNNPRSPFVEPPRHTVIRVESADAAFIYQRFLEQLKDRNETPRHFADLLALQNWFDSNANEVLEDRVRRGYFRRMCDYEVEVALRKKSEAVADN